MDTTPTSSRKRTTPGGNSSEEDSGRTRPSGQKRSKPEVHLETVPPFVPSRTVELFYDCPFNPPTTSGQFSRLNDCLLPYLFAHLSVKIAFKLFSFRLCDRLFLKDSLLVQSCTFVVYDDDLTSRMFLYPLAGLSCAQLQHLFWTRVPGYIRAFSWENTLGCYRNTWETMHQFQQLRFLYRFEMVYSRMLANESRMDIFIPFKRLLTGRARVLCNERLRRLNFECFDRLLELMMVQKVGEHDNHIQVLGFKHQFWQFRSDNLAMRWPFLVSIVANIRSLEDMKELHDFSELYGDRLRALKVVIDLNPLPRDESQNVKKNYLNKVIKKWFECFQYWENLEKFAFHLHIRGYTPGTQLFNRKVNQGRSFFERNALEHLPTSVTKLTLKVHQPEGVHNPNTHNWLLSTFPNAEVLIIQLYQSELATIMRLEQSARLHSLYLIEVQEGVLERLRMNAYLPRVQRLKLETVSQNIGPFLRVLSPMVPNLQRIWAPVRFCQQLDGAQAVRNFLPRCTHFELLVDDLWSEHEQLRMIELIRAIDERARSRSNTHFVVKMIIVDEEACPFLDLFHERIQRIGLADNLKTHC